MSTTVKIMTMNIGNPSIERARKQIEWIKNRNEDIFVLTETKNSAGCALIEEVFSEHRLDGVQSNINVVFPRSATKDLGVMCLSKYPIKKTEFAFKETNQYYSRYLYNEISLYKQKIKTVGLYVPSRNQTPEKIIRKKNFLEQTINSLKKLPRKSTIVCGDFNIVDRDHIPHYNTFKKWEYLFYDQLIELGYVDAFKKCNPGVQEYSWVGRTNSGYRYDYCFVSSDIQEQIVDCYFVHDTRNMRLTDHSALVVELSL